MAMGNRHVLKKAAVVFDQKTGSGSKRNVTAGTGCQSVTSNELHGRSVESLLLNLVLVFALGNITKAQLKSSEYNNQQWECHNYVTNSDTI